MLSQNELAAKYIHLYTIGKSGENHHQNIEKKTILKLKASCLSLVYDETVPNDTDKVRRHQYSKNLPYSTV